MIIQKKPDYLIFADSAKKGEVTDFPDVSRGWGITIDQTASKPPLEWMNGAFNRIDKNMLYLLQQGVPEWSESVTYPANAIIKYNGILYTAIVSNENARPSTNTTKWKKTQEEIKEGSLTQMGIVKLNSSIDSTLENEAATPLAIKQVNDNVNTKISAITEKFSSNQNQTTVFSPDGRFQIFIRNDGLIGGYNLVEKKIMWSFHIDGFLNGNTLTNNIIGLDEFVRARTLPVGIPYPWPRAQIPEGFLECNGSPFDVNQFPKLAKAYPNGRLPDLRGEFIRGWDNGRNVDKNRNILSNQGDAIRNITGSFGNALVSSKISDEGAFYHSTAISPAYAGNNTGFHTVFKFDVSRVVPTANENRPRNIAFMYIVKAE